MSERLETGKQLSVLLMIFSLILSVATAHACETGEYNPSPSELRKNAINYFEEVTVVYEGVILGSHDFETGGRFLVLRSYKGPAAAFDIIELPGGSSCYGNVPMFSMGIAANHFGEWTSFDGLVNDEEVDIWKEQGLVASGIRSPIVILKIVIVALLALMVGLIFFWHRRNRAKKTA